MILSRSKQYALLALIDLASRPPAEYVLSRDIAARIKLPHAYLSKLLQTLAHSGLVESVRGRRGGFRLARPAGRISVREVMNLMDGGREERECLLGLKACRDEDACALHCQWRPVKEGLIDLLERETLGHLAGESGAGA